MNKAIQYDILIKNGTIIDGSGAPGFKADLLVLDPDKIEDVADFEKSHQLARDFDWVFINGESVRADGEFTTARPGKMLRK